MADLQAVLDRMTATGELYEVVDAAQKKIRCYACGHRCLIKDGGRGVCKVRFNVGGELRVPHGYVGALQVDPIEKKPFNHVNPGVLALSFGMLGCDLHCDYCFTPETRIVTSLGVLPIARLFTPDTAVDRPDGAQIAFPEGLQAVTASGQRHPVTKVFKHPYRGQVVTVKPYYLPDFTCTPDHRIYATDDPTRAPTLLQARLLTTKHYLAVPRHHAWGTPQVVDCKTAFEAFAHEVKVPHKLPAEEVQFILAESARGVTSRELGLALGKDPSYIRHVRSKNQRGIWVDSKEAAVQLEGDTIRFAKEHRPGIPRFIEMDERAARLIGLYCAEGSIQIHSSRPNSFSLYFSFGLHEQELVAETAALLESVFHITSRIVKRDTTLAVTTAKTGVALFFLHLCGNGSAEKRVPQVILDSPQAVAAAFLDAYVTGDGHCGDQGKINATTKSADLAYGVAWLALKMGCMASVYANQVEPTRLIQGRTVNQTPVQYSVVWYLPASTTERRFVVTEANYLIPIRSLDESAYDGPVYNLEVEDDHSYLANFASVSNCQNWDISQFGRNKEAGRDPVPVTADELVHMARSRRARAVASTYNEPLITSEWAVSVFKRAKAAGLRTLYISNGNGTREVIDYLRPHLDAYKIDLKSMRDKNYRQLGAVLQNVLDTIQYVKDVGLWLEVVTLIVPGFNDSSEELWDAARFLAGVSPDIPWHVTAFHPDYQMTDPPRTTTDTLQRAAEIGAEAGLHYVYAGNIPGRVGEWEHTYCPSCHEAVVKRYGFAVLEDRLSANGGRCPRCGTLIPGIWA